MKDAHSEILAKKITVVLSDHYARYWKAKNAGWVDYISINEKLVEKLRLAIRDYEVNKEKYGK
jgi:hypothetical protein